MYICHAKDNRYRQLITAIVMKRFIYVIFMTLGLMAITPQNANAQFSGLLRGAIEKGTQAAKNKKAAKEYNALVDAANAAIENHDLRYFCAANRREELRRAAAAAEIDNSDMDYKVQKFLSDETDLNNTDYIASARGLLARSKAEEDIPTSNYLLKCAKIQYSAELEKADPETIPLLKDLYADIIAYENTFTNGRDKGAEITDPSALVEDLAKLEKMKKDPRLLLFDFEIESIDELPKVEGGFSANVRPSESSSSSSSSEAKDEEKLPGEYPDFYNNSHEWKDKNNKVIAAVSSDGTVYRGSQYGGGTRICQIKKNGEIYVSGSLWGQVMKQSGDFIIYQYDRNGKNPRKRGSVNSYSNGRVEWEYSYMGDADHIKDKNGNELVPHDRGNTTFVHRAVAFFLYDKIR